MVKNSELLYETDHISIYYDSKNNILINDWKGLLTLETVQDGCLKMIELFKLKPSSKVLNMNIHLEGSWAIGVKWTSEVWAPQMIEAGLKHFAWVHSKENYAEMSAQRMVNRIESEEKDEMFVPFGDYEEAFIWLVAQ